VAVAGLVILVVAGYLALIVVTRIDELFFPGQGISVGGFSNLPGVGEDPGEGQGRLNILVMGLDRRPREGEAPARTDTMFVLTIDRGTKTAGILGIPRDLWVEIPTRDGSAYYEERINTAFITGETSDYPGGGPAVAEEVIEHNLGIPIDHYVIVDFEGFVEIINDIGGIDVFVEEEIYDPYYSRTELPGDYYPLHFLPGEQHMDGETALDYSRTRFDSSDLDRIKRQQQVIFAAINKATDEGLVSIDSLVDRWRQYRDTVDTDVNDIQAPGFARLAAQTDPADIVALSIGAATVPWTGPQGQAVLLADKDLVQQLVNALFGDRELEEEAAHVEVQDAATQDDLSDRVVGYLDDFGFSPDALTAASSPAGTAPALTEIIDFSGKNYTAELLANLLDVPVTQVRDATAADRALSTVANADVLVILGADAQAREFTQETASGG
jgi:LCP family protein required for cell wall assembly